MMPQLLCHIFGDYLLQSDYLASNKNKKTFPCLVHVLIYTSIFLFLTTSWKALLIIGGTHFIIDRFPVIIRRLIWFKNHLNPTLSYPPFDLCNTTGYFDDSPYNKKKSDIYKVLWKGLPPRHFFITVWLYIITDNFCHLFFNYIALTYFK